MPCADGQFETSPVSVPAWVSSEPVKMQTNTPREGIIHLDVAVTDNKGKPVLGLTAKDLKLTDNGAPQAIDSFAASNQQPANEDERLTEVVLLLDEVNCPAADDFANGEVFERSDSETSGFFRGTHYHRV
jgi:hypothetical protein